MSELTPLEDSTDEGESEIDPPESPVETPTPTLLPTPSSSLPTITPTETKRQPRPEKHRLQCASLECVNLLPRYWNFRFCDVCRLRSLHVRRQQKQAMKEGNRALDAWEDIPVSGPIWLADVQMRGLMVYMVYIATP